QDLLRELADVLKDEFSPEATKQLQELAKAMEVRQRERREQELQAALADLAKSIAVLKQVTKAEPERHALAGEFEGVFKILTERLIARAAVTVPDGNAAAATNRFFAGMGVRSFDFGTRLDRPADVRTTV